MNLRMTRLRLQREKRGLTQLELARQSGIHNTTLSKAETGKGSLTSAQLTTLAGILDYVPPAATLLDRVFLVEQTESR